MMSPFLQKLCLVAIFVREEEERPQEEEEDDVQIKKLLSKFFFLKSGPFPASFSFIFVFSIQLIINKCSIKFCRWLESNHGPLVLKATALPTAPQPLPVVKILTNTFVFVPWGSFTHPVWLTRFHGRHLRGRDFSLAVFGELAAWKAMALNLGANQYTGLTYSAKVCFMAVGNITTTVNKGRQAGRMSGLFL